MQFIVWYAYEKVKEPFVFMAPLHTPIRILVVDDDPGFSEIVSTKLQAAHFEVFTAFNGEEAITAVNEYAPDLVLMDVQMPVLDGIEAAMRILEDPKTKDTRILFVTNLGDPWRAATESNRRFAQEIGALDYFKKGSDLDMLVEKINDLLSSAQKTP